MRIYGRVLLIVLAAIIIVPCLPFIVAMLGSFVAHTFYGCPYFSEAGPPQCSHGDFFYSLVIGGAWIGVFVATAAMAAFWLWCIPAIIWLFIFLWRSMRHV